MFNININVNMVSKLGGFEGIPETISDSYQAILIIVDEGFSNSILFNEFEKNLILSSKKIKKILVSGSSEPTYDDLRKYSKKVNFIKLYNNKKKGIGSAI